MEKTTSGPGQMAQAWWRGSLAQTTSQRMEEGTLERVLTKRSKGKGTPKGKSKAGKNTKGRPFTVWTARGRKEVRRDTCDNDDAEVVDVEVEPEENATLSAHGRDTNEALTMEEAMHMWRAFLDIEDDGQMGYPEWALDRVRDTIEEWPVADVSALLAAHQQFVGLIMAQIAEIIQRRINRVEQQEDGDHTNLMQASRFVKPADGGLSTYGLELQFLTDELSQLPVYKARVRSALFRGVLAKRYGCAAGRASMGTRAMALEAAIVAFDDGNSRMAVDALVEDEREILGLLAEEAEMQAWEKAKWDKELADYEQDRQMQEQIDIASYESLQAHYAQEWDDWVLWKSMNKADETQPQRKRQRLVLHLQVQRDATQSAVLDLPVVPGDLVTLGMTWTVTEEDTAAASSGSSQCSTVRVTSERGSELPTGTYFCLQSYR